MDRLTIDNFCATISGALGQVGIDNVYFTTSFDRVNEGDIYAPVWIITIPRRWPIPDRQAGFDCWLPVEFDIWCGIQVMLDIAVAADIDTRDEAIEGVLGAIEALEDDDHIQLTRPRFVETFDFRDGQAINRFAWAKATIQAKFKQT